MDLLFPNINPIICIQGAVGIGKTSFCQHYFWHQWENFKHLAWIEYSGSLQESFVNQFMIDRKFFAEQDTTEERFNKILYLLKQLDQNSLLIINGFDNPNDKYFSKIVSLPFKIIMSSRYVWDNYQRLSMGVLNKEQCKLLFQKFYQRKINKSALEKIIKISGHHPLIIELLAKIANHKALALSRFLKNLQEVDFNLGKIFSDEIIAKEKSDIQEKKLSDHLEKVLKLSDVSETETLILANLVVLSSIPIASNELCEWLKLESPEYLNKLIQKGWIKQLSANNNSCQDVTETKLLLQPVIEKFFKNQLKPDYQICKNLIDSIIQKLQIELGEDPFGRKRYAVLGSAILENISEKNQSLGNLSDHLAEIYYALGPMDKALEYQLKALALWENLIEENDPCLASAYHRLADMYQKSGEINKALEFQVKSLVIREETLEENHPDLASTYDSLSRIYEAQGKLDESLTYQLKSLAIHETLLGENHPNLSYFYNHLSQIYHGLGHIEKALQFQLKTVSTWECILDKNDPDLAASYNNLSQLYHALGNLNEALDFQLKALAIRETTLNQNHPSLAQSYNNLSLIHHALGHLDQAMEYQLKAIKIKKEVLGEKSSSLATSYNNLAQIYKAARKLDKAIKFQLKDIAIRESVLNKNDPLLATSYNNLSLIYKALNQLDDALAYQIRALAIKEFILGKSHSSLATTYKNLAQICQALGQLDKALEYQEKNVEIRVTNFGKKHSRVAQAYKYLSTLYFAKKDYLNAFKLALKVVSIYKKNYPKGHPDLDAAFTQLDMIKKYL